jgi:FADH2 O2-dependent halogenase
MAEAVDFDVGIIGGGPAGASLGAYLAKAGLRCVVFEKEIFPRAHVGESLVPSSTRVFREIDFLEQMEASRFPRKYGAVWTSSQSGRQYHHSWDGVDVSGAEIDFAERDQPGVPQPYTYHVDRGLFDQLLLEHAARLGASVFQGSSVRRVDFSEETPVLHVTGSDGDRTVRVQFVADASGRNTVLASQLALKIRDNVFDQFAVHTWFEDYDRLSALSNERYADYIYVHFLPISNSWVWQIPITDKITSIGVVTQKKNFVSSKSELAPFFWRSLESRRELYDGLRKANQLRPLKAEGDYSYAAKQIVGDRFLLLGDAGRFVDPIFSTGVSIALNSARFASADIINAFEAGSFQRERFRTFETTIRRGTNNWYEFISLYYRLNVLFTTFVSSPRYRLDVLKLLQGDVYDEQPPLVLSKMRDIVTEVEQNEQHPWHSLLGSLTANAFRPAY